MADSEHRLSALDGIYRVGTIGGVAETGPAPALDLCERRGLTLIHLAGPDHEDFHQAVESRTGIALPSQANTGLVSNHRLALWTGPGQWLIVSADGFPEAIEAALAGIAAHPSVAVTNLSQGRTVIRVAGAAARDLLAKGCSLDLHARNFRTGDCAQTSLAAIGVLLHAADDAPAFDLYIPRSYARSAWEWLIDAAAEFGCRVIPPA